MNRNWAQRIVDRLGAHPLLVFLMFISTVLTAALAVGGAAVLGYRWYDSHFQWREREYNRLTSLRAGFALSKFEEDLGSPVFRRPVDTQHPRPYGRRLRMRLTESSFQGRDYWVQTISDSMGTVLVYAVTSCNAKFTPTFRGPYGHFSVTLNKSTFADVVPWKDAESVISQHFPSGATANSFFFDVMYGGNPMDYKTFAWGLNDACEGWYERYEALFDSKLIPLRPGKWWQHDARAWRGGRVLRRFRAKVRVNTYAETAPARWEFDLRRSPFQIGVDRILTRTLWKSET